ncbi:sulfite exporter TauE/SafE family protein [Polymorphobacter fuscus]|uniref:Probable membrane transporter protein n=1 Tax=Sandarakinorhabdus fusca TaxID=1439888 RepID=A0A7C9GY69_9SPHN|nr:sulfite exporter TauE/SafE family protein [Polymorphobacter fuscus]KAB7646510.1 sulfite exporter TauE/SafE family protein [Polymorphobacter fuscus]MQT17754.1 TSUP family transporter [Polymorphobacter fuscus]NJC09698.1 hypothetical protein [Polymorphobacter fuscus]
MLTDPLFYMAAIPSVILLGLAKGGFSGIGILGVPLLALVISPVQAAAILLPILIVQDAISVWAFYRTRDDALLMQMLPAAAIGVAAGYLLAAHVSVPMVELAVGVITLGFAVQRIRAGDASAATVAGRWGGALMGAASGFTSQIAHAGGPPFQMHVMPMRLDRDRFIGTSAIFFAIVNWMKVPAYAALGQFTAANMKAAAVLMPLAIVATWAGVRLVRRVDAANFYRIIYALMVVVGAKLIWDGATGL